MKVQILKLETPAKNENLVEMPVPKSSIISLPVKPQIPLLWVELPFDLPPEFRNGQFTDL